MLYHTTLASFLRRNRTKTRAFFSATNVDARETRLASSKTSARAARRASSPAMRPYHPARSSDTWIVPAARRARQVSGRAAEALDARLSARDELGGGTVSDPFSEDAREDDPRTTRASHDSETLVDMLLSGRLEAAPPGAPEEPTVPGPRAFGLRNEARGDVGGVVPSPAPAPWNQPWPKTRVPGARFHHIPDEERIAGSISPRGPHARRRDVLRETQRAFPDRDDGDVPNLGDDLERRARASGVFQRFATPVFSGESRDARAGTGTGTGTGSSDVFDRSLRYPGVHSPYESKGESREEASRRRRGGGVASAEESRLRRMRDKAAALENLREVRRALGKSSPPRRVETRGRLGGERTGARREGAPTAKTDRPIDR